MFVSFENRGNTMIRRVILMITRLVLSCSQALKAWLRPLFFCCLVKRFCGLPRYDRLRTLTRWPLLLLSTSHFPQIYGARKGHPQTAYQADFSVRIAHRSPEGTATSTILSGFLCSNGPRQRFPWPARLSWRQQQKLSAVFGFPTYALRHARHRGQGSFIAKLSGQERRRDMHPMQS